MKKIPAGMLENLDTLIDLSRQKTDLLIQFKKSLIYENSVYHLVKIDQSMYSYQLIKIATKETVKSGVLEEIRSFLNLRKIDKSAVYQDLNNIL